METLYKQLFNSKFCIFVLPIYLDFCAFFFLKKKRGKRRHLGHDKIIINLFLRHIKRLNIFGTHLEAF